MSDDSGLRTQLLLSIAENLREVEHRLADFEKSLSELGIEDAKSASDLKRMIDSIEAKIAVLQRDKLTTPEWLKVFGREWPKAIALIVVGAIIAKITGIIEWLTALLS